MDFFTPHQPIRLPLLSRTHKHPNTPPSRSASPSAAAAAAAGKDRDRDPEYLRQPLAGKRKPMKDNRDWDRQARGEAGSGAGALALTPPPSSSPGPVGAGEIGGAGGRGGGRAVGLSGGSTGVNVNVHANANANTPIQHRFSLQLPLSASTLRTPTSSSPTTSTTHPLSSPLPPSSPPLYPSSPLAPHSHRLHPSPSPPTHLAPPPESHILILGRSRHTPPTPTLASQIPHLALPTLSPTKPHAFRPLPRSARHASRYHLALELVRPSASSAAFPRENQVRVVVLGQNGVRMGWEGLGEHKRYSVGRTVVLPFPSAGSSNLEIDFYSCKTVIPFPWPSGVAAPVPTPAPTTITTTTTTPAPTTPAPKPAFHLPLPLPIPTFRQAMDSACSSPLSVLDSPAVAGMAGVGGGILERAGAVVEEEMVGDEEVQEKKIERLEEKEPEQERAEKEGMEVDEEQDMEREREQERIQDLQEIKIEEQPAATKDHDVDMDADPAADADADADASLEPTSHTPSSPLSPTPLALPLPHPNDDHSPPALSPPASASTSRPSSSHSHKRKPSNPHHVKEEDAAPLPPQPEGVDFDALIATTLVFSGSSAVGLGDLVRNVLESQPSMRELGSEHVWTGWIQKALAGKEMFGSIERKGKDASGKRLLPLYFYLPSSDPDKTRASELGGLVRPLRGAQRKGGKAIDWRPVGGGRRKRDGEGD